MNRIDCNYNFTHFKRVHTMCTRLSLTLPHAHFRKSLADLDRARLPRKRKGKRTHDSHRYDTARRDARPSRRSFPKPLLKRCHL